MGTWTRGNPGPLVVAPRREGDRVGLIGKPEVDRHSWRAAFVCNAFCDQDPVSLAAARSARVDRAYAREAPLGTGATRATYVVEILP